jgi:Ca2+/Na+ antiporter
MEVLKSLFYYLYCLVDFVVRQCWRWTLAVVLGLYVYLAVDIARQAAKKSPTVLDLIYWRDVRKSGIVFGVTLVLLLSFMYFNVVTVLSYLGLILLAATLGYRVYTAVTATVNKTEQRNPFQPYLEKHLDLPQDRAHEHIDSVMKHVKDLLLHLRRLFLVENICESVKFGLFLWSLTYVGEYVCGTTLIILAFIGIFTLPKVYEMYQPQIDQYYNMAEQKLRPVIDTVKHQTDKFCCNKKTATVQPHLEKTQLAPGVVHEKAF